MSYWVGDPERLIVKIGIVEVEEQDQPTDTKDVDRKPILFGGLPVMVTNDGNRTTNVTLKILVSVFGLARKVIIEGELPDNIREQVLLAACTCRFRPAIKDGHPVAYWTNVTIESVSTHSISTRIGSL